MTVTVSDPQVNCALKSLPQPRPRVAPTRAVQHCYSVMDVSQAANIRDLADGLLSGGDARGRLSAKDLLRLIRGED